MQLRRLALPNSVETLRSQSKLSRQPGTNYGCSAPGFAGVVGFGFSNSQVQVGGWLRAAARWPGTNINRTSHADTKKHKAQRWCNPSKFADYELHLRKGHSPGSCASQQAQPLAGATAALPKWFEKNGAFGSGCRAHPSSGEAFAGRLPVSADEARARHLSIAQDSADSWGISNRQSATAQPDESE